MADRLRPILDAYLGGGVPANVALMRLCMDAGSAAEVRTAIAEAVDRSALDQAGHLSPRGRGIEAEPPAPASDRLATLAGLLEDHPSAWATVRAVMAEAEHDREAASADEAVAHWAGVFDRLAAAQPEAGVALYALGSPDLLADATREIVEALRGWGLVGGGSTVLEIGCGIGRFVRALAPEVSRVTGLDLSPGMIAAARERCAGLPNVRLAVSSGRDLAGVEDDAFDLVLAADVFPYLVAAGDGLAARHVAEAARVLRPGGTLAILNYSYRGDPDRDRREIAAAAREAGLGSAGEPRPGFRCWDGTVFLLRRPG